MNKNLNKLLKQKASSLSIAQLLKQVPDVKGTDYDIEGYYADHGIPYKSLEDMALSHAITGAHYSDEDKLPWHPSFSTHSKYSDQDMEGGKWQQGGGEGSELWNFTPSEINMEYSSPEAYKQMWLENQPKGTFITLPSGDVIEGNERNYAEGGSVADRYASFKHNPLAFALGQGDEVRYADETSNKQYPNEGHNGRADALRHMLWQAKLQQAYGDIPATLAGKAHEMFSMSQPEAESAMDLHNNEIGLRLGKENKTDADILRKAIEAVDSGEAKVLHGKQQEVMYAEGGSVEYNPDTVDQIIDDTHKELGTGRYANGGSVENKMQAIPQNENLAALAEALSQGRDIANKVDIPYLGGVGDLLVGKTPEEIENWSYGNAPMQIPEMSNLPQFKKGRGESFADAATTLLPMIKGTKDLPAGLSFIGPNSKGWDKATAELAAKQLDEGVDPAQVWQEHMIGRLPSGHLFSEISDAPLTVRSKNFNDPYGSYGINSNKHTNFDEVQDLLDEGYPEKTIHKMTGWARPQGGEWMPPLDRPLEQKLIEHDPLSELYDFHTLKTRGRLSEAPLSSGHFNSQKNEIVIDADPDNKGMLQNTRGARSVAAHELQHAIQGNEGWPQGGSPDDISAYYAQKVIQPNINDLNKKIEEKTEQRWLLNGDEYKANVLEHKDLVNQRSQLLDELNNLNENLAPRHELYKRLTGEAQARATQDRLDMDMAQRRENYPLAGDKLSDISLKDLIDKYEGVGYAGGGAVVKGIKKIAKNLNEALLGKHLAGETLTPDEMIKYEKNALKMEDPNTQHYNVENAMAQPEREAYKAEHDIDFLHGTERLDRLLSKAGLDPKRATSGPMAFGTDSPAIASNYATGKKDTSILDTDDWNYSKAYTVLPKDMGLRGTSPYTVEQSWYHLPPEVKKDILSKAPRVGYSDIDEGAGDLMLHPETQDAINKSHFDYLLKEHRNNPLAALRDYWVDSGNLYDEEQKLEDIYKAAGYPHPISQDTAPWASATGVLLGRSRITNPLDTSNISELQEKVIPALKDAFKNDRSRLKLGADQWDKNSKFTPKDWVNELESDVNKGENSYVFTSIPDKVTAALKDIGYNGIYDMGGKGGGASHQVTIPFEPSQIRSRFAAFDPLRKNSPSLLASVLGGTALSDLALKYGDNEDVGYASGGAVVKGIKKLAMKASEALGEIEGQPLFVTQTDRTKVGGSVDKDSMELNKPQRTPNHPTKSHIVKTMVDGKEKIIRFGEQGAETAGKPKEGESDRMKAKRDSFKARHAKNIAKGPSSAAYWANKVKWNEGGDVEFSQDKVNEIIDAMHKELGTGK